MEENQISWKAKIILILFGCGLGLAAIELALRFIPLAGKGTEFGSIEDVRRAMIAGDASSPADLGDGTGPVSLRGIVIPNQNDRIIYTLRPNLDLRFVRANLKTNSCGMRSPEISVNKPANTFRIALLGDSFAFGWGVEQNQNFASILEENLNRIFKGSPKIEVLNFGVPGYSTFQEVALFEELGLDFKPDLALVYFVQNDFGMPFFIRDIDGSGGILSSLQFVNIGRKLLAPGEMDRKVNEMGLDPNHALKRLAEVGKQNGIPIFLTINPRKEWQSDLKRLWAVKKRGEINFINLRDQLMRIVEERKIKEEDLTLSFDPHPSPIRHKILGDLLTPWIMSRI